MQFECQDPKRLSSKLSKMPRLPPNHTHILKTHTCTTFSIFLTIATTFLVPEEDVPVLNTFFAFTNSRKRHFFLNPSIY